MSEPNLHFLKSGVFILTGQYMAFLGMCILLSCCATKNISSADSKRLPAPATVILPESYPSAQAYLQARQQLVERDSLRDFDGQVVLSAEEQVLNQKLTTLRKEMTAYYDSIHFFPSSHYFYKSRQHLYTTRLYQLLQQMPKGGLHHLHATAGVSFLWLIQRAVREPYCYVYWQQDSNIHMPRKAIY